jgi:DUF971 family protein
MTSTTPRAIRLDVRESRLEIDWADGVTSRYEGGYLRFVCPCAGCRGHAPGEIPPPKWEDCANVRITGAQAVGGYAVRFDFTDHHSTGIYSFDWLREHAPK